MVRNITEDDEGVLLAGDVNNKLIFIHGIKNLGGIRSRKENKVIGNIGLTEKANTVNFHEDLWELPLSLRAPSAKTLIECDSADEAKEKPATAAFRTLRAITIPPWVVKCLLESDLDGEEGIDPFVAIIELTKGARAFDEEYDDNEEFGEKAIDHVGYILRFLWCLGREEIYETSFSLDINDQEVNDYHLSTHQTFIENRESDETGNEDNLEDRTHPPSRNNESDIFDDSDDEREESSEEAKILQRALKGEGASWDSFGIKLGEGDAAMRMSAAMMARLNESLVTQNKLKAIEIKAATKKEKEKKDRTLDFHESTVWMLLCAGAPRSMALSKIPNSALRFFNAKSAGKADQELMSQFEEMGLGLVGFAPGLIQSLYNGDLLWHNSVDPKNLSVFMVFKRGVMETEQKSRYLLFHLQEKQGSKRSVEEILASTKQTIRVPTSFHEMVYQLRCFRGLIQVFLGHQSFVVRQLVDLTAKVENLEERLTAASHSDEKFIAAFLYSIDLMCQEFLKECKLKSDRSFVDEQLLDFDSVIQRVRLQQFPSYLPPTFTSVDSGSKGEDMVVRNSKRRKLGGEDDLPEDKGSNIVQNESQPEEFKMAPGESWEKDWCGRVADGRPSWGKNKMCPRFHTKGYCFKQCRNKASHVPFSRVPDAKRKEYKQWMADARAKRGQPS